MFFLYEFATSGREAIYCVPGRVLEEILEHFFSFEKGGQILLSASEKGEIYFSFVCE